MEENVLRIVSPPGWHREIQTARLFGLEEWSIGACKILRRPWMVNRIHRGERGNMDMVSVKAECRISHCTKSAVTALSGEELCLDHFFACCYERLDQLEPMVRRRSLEVSENLAARAFLEECSHRTLLICLRHELLSNLDRSRLLNILLLTGDLQLLLRKKLIRHADSVSDLSALFFGKSSPKTRTAEDQKEEGFRNNR